MSSEFVYNSQNNKVMSGGYMIGSKLFKENVDVEHILNENGQRAVPIGLLNFNGGGNKIIPFDQNIETHESGLNSNMIGGSVFDNMLNQMSPYYKSDSHSKNIKGGLQSRKTKKQKIFLANHRVNRNTKKAKK